jgi:hypothetical protein
MRTEEDLRAAFAAREDLTPDASTVLSAVRRRGPRRRAGDVAVVLAATAAVAAAVIVAVPLTAAWRTPAGPAPDGTSPALGASASGAQETAMATAPSGARPPFAFTLSPVTVGGFSIEPIAVGTDVQIATVRAKTGSAEPATLYVHDAGSRSHAPDKGTDEAAKVQVNGRAGWVFSTARASTLKWEYAPDAWALITSEPGPVLPRQTLVTLAEGIRFTAAYQVRVPYRLGYLPSGLKPFNVVQRTGDPAGPTSVVKLADDASGVVGGRIMDITVLNGRRAAGPRRPAGWQPAHTIAGRPALCTDLVDGRRCAVDFGQFTVDIGAAALDTGTVERIVAAMSFATWPDPSTWYGLDTAMPTR